MRLPLCPDYVCILIRTDWQVYGSGGSGAVVEVVAVVAVDWEVDWEVIFTSGRPTVLPSHRLRDLRRPRYPRQNSEILPQSKVLIKKMKSCQYNVGGYSSSSISLSELRIPRESQFDWPVWGWCSWLGLRVRLGVRGKYKINDPEICRTKQKFWPLEREQIEVRYEETH